MKQKIGFIDLFVDEWHANNYPAWFKSAARADEFELAYAWQKEQREGLRTLDKWCADFGVTPAKSIEDLVEKCDAILVLAPSNPEVHEELASIPLASGKKVYIDKPFAPDKAAAERLFARADQFHTQMFSSSALRFSAELRAAAAKFAPDKIEVMNTRGGGSSFEEYSIHQAEMIVSTMGTGIHSVMQCGTGRTNHTIIRYKDGRRASMTLNPRTPFSAAIYNSEQIETIPATKDFFPILINAMLDFFATGKLPVDRKETIEIAALVSAAIKALRTPDCWVEL